MSPDDQVPELRQQAEIIQEIDRLSEADWYKIGKAAGHYCRGSEFDSADDLINEAVVRMMNAAVDGVGLKRRWKKGVSLVAFLIRTMKGLANDSRESADRKDSLQFEALAPEGTTGEDFLSFLGHHSDDHPELPLRAAEAQRDLDQIFEKFKDDTEVQSLILGREDDLPASEIQSTFGITKKQYEAASKRLRRGFDQLFPGK